MQYIQNISLTLSIILKALSLYAGEYIRNISYPSTFYDAKENEKLNFISKLGRHF